MKKVFLMLFLMILAIPIFAQEPTVPPVSWGEVFSNPALWLGSFAGVSLLTAFVAAFVNGLLKVVKNLPKQLVAWGIAIIITTLAGAVANLKIVYTWELPIWLAILHGFLAGLAANGAFDIPALKSILKSIEALFIKPTPTPTP
jgi:fructose-specific phosphotransferase system IIC component